MNEKIKALALEAKQFARAQMAHPMDPAIFSASVFEKKFAELVVRECARTAAHFSIENKRIHPDIDPCNMPDANRMVYHATCQCVADEIRKHFGVEE